MKDFEKTKEGCVFNVLQARIEKLQAKNAVLMYTIQVQKHNFRKLQEEKEKLEKEIKDYRYYCGVFA